MSKLQKIFDQCRKENRSAMIVFCSCGFPDEQTGERMIETAIEAGADIIELGIPFSDPTADGPVIQLASQIAIKNGAALSGILAMAERISARHPKTGFILFSYLNVMMNYGLDSLCSKLKKIGVDGILSVDVPYEESEEIDQFCRSCSLDLISLISPATGLDRMKTIIKESRGFVYYVSMKGVTGNSSRFSSDLEERVRRLKDLTSVPLAVGFGISSPEDVRFMSRFADGFVIGSASLKIFIEHPEENKEEKMKKYYDFLKICSKESFRDRFEFQVD